MKQPGSRLIRIILVLWLSLLPALSAAAPLPIDLSGGTALDEALMQGKTVYEDPTIRVETHRIENADTPFNAIIHYATISIRDASQLRTAAALDFTSKAAARASDMAKRNNAVLAVNGDFYGVRPETYVLRQGTVYRDTVGENLDVLLIDEAGDFHVLFAGDNPAAQDKTTIHGKRVINAFAFGPALIVNDQVVLNKKSSPIMSTPDSRSPRMCIVQTGPLQYMVITCRSVGVTLEELVGLVQQLTDHVMVAYTLDGGQSAQMVFMNRLLNKMERDARRVTDILYFASSYIPGTEKSTAFATVPPPAAEDTSSGTPLLPSPARTPSPSPTLRAATISPEPKDEPSPTSSPALTAAGEPQDTPSPPLSAAAADSPVPKDEPSPAAAARLEEPPSVTGNAGGYWAWMGAVTLLGILGGGWILSCRGHRPLAGWWLSGWALVTALLCSRLGYAVQQLHYVAVPGSSFHLFSTDPGEWSVICGWGGAALGTALGAITWKGKPLRPMETLNALAPWGAFLLGLVRLCAIPMAARMMDWGTALETPGRFPGFLTVVNAWGETYLAVYVLEAAAAFAVGAAGFLLLRKKTFLRVAFYLCLTQIFLESLRGDSLQWLFLRTEQLLSLTVVLTILFLHGRRLRTALPLATGFACTLLLALVEFALDKSDMSVSLLYGIMGAGLLVLAFAEIACCRSKPFRTDAP